MTSSKQQILVAAAACFMEQGFHTTTIDDVARRLGATKGRIYHHYPAKIDLFFDVHREGMARLFRAVEPAMQAPGDGLTVLAAMLHAHALALMDNYDFESVVVQGVQLHRFGALTPAQRQVLDELIASRDQFESLFKQQAEAARRDGSMAELDVSVAVKTMLGALQWSLIWYRPEADAGPSSRAALAAAMVRTLINGLQRRS
ncbi:TetR family transcriptional regulator [Pseudoroseomonas wenyumeiae]|uniref:TetR family transcriptional regulator n=1 Tax=Teichococcus wenyumeiae TaxID=2478470 RepID=A0A3A9JF29_9PROT|nr:TetR family transcriptional regulator [Pseudoroseomonas wenyumeiae]RKK02124.1 TetR/AcrR family transcriptional regulator [Pseudoroseomonas wenyumeiae]RMI15491.1 TetR family transcriptional regulator [Pseudoroseomonas wenyumeiae]